MDDRGAKDTVIVCMTRVFSENLFAKCGGEVERQRQIERKMEFKIRQQIRY